MRWDQNRGRSLATTEGEIGSEKGLEAVNNRECDGIRTWVGAWQQQRVIWDQNRGRRLKKYLSCVPNAVLLINFIKRFVGQNNKAYLNTFFVRSL